MRPTGADLDGTWTDHPEVWGEVDFIATGNGWKNQDHVDEINPTPPVFLNPGKEELMDIVMHKANVINKTNAQKFFENQAIQVDLLKTMCPNCRIILVKPNVTAI